MLGDKMNIIQLEEVSSTNLYAKENLDSFEDKTVIIAISQTSGRGRFDRKWVDLGEGNLFMTIVLKPSNLFEEDVFKDSNRSLNGISSIFSCSCLIELSVLFIASVPI